MRKLVLATAFALPLLGSVATAEETLKIGYIDPLPAAAPASARSA